MKKGLFIVVEGIDGSGKTTLVEGLSSIFVENGINFVKNFEPTKSNAFGILVRHLIHNDFTYEKFKSLEESINQLSLKILNINLSSAFSNIFQSALYKLKNQIELLEIEYQSLFIADRYFDLQNTILPALQQHKIVLQDRFNISSAAYALGSAGILPEDIFYLEKEVLKDVYCIPDIKIFLDLSPQKALERIQARRMLGRYETLERLKKIRDAYYQVLSLKKDEGKTYIVDASLSSSSVLKNVYSLIFPSSKSL